jgi:hypothetical protein
MSDDRAPKPTMGPIRRRILDAALCNARLARMVVARDRVMREAYDDVRRIEALARAETLGTASLEGIEARLFATIGTVQDEVREEARQEAAREAATRAVMALPARRHLFAGGMGALAASAALFLFFVDDNASPTHSDDVLQARGVAELPMVGVRVRCLASRDEGGVTVAASAEAGPKAPLGAMPCQAGNLLSFAVTNVDEDPVHIFIVGLAGRDLRWYAPFDANARSVTVNPGTRDEPLATLADTSTLPASARTTLYLLFSPHALDGRTIRAELDAASRRGSLTSALDRLPVGVRWQARIELTDAMTREAP